MNLPTIIAPLAAEILQTVARQLLRRIDGVLERKRTEATKGGAAKGAATKPNTPTIMGWSSTR